MRRILVEQRPRQAAAEARRRPCGGSTSTLAELGYVAPAEDLLALDEALDRLAAEDPQAAELVKLRYFAGLSVEEAAEVLGISRRPPPAALGLRPGLAAPRASAAGRARPALEIFSIFRRTNSGADGALEVVEDP